MKTPSTASAEFTAKPETPAAPIPATQLLSQDGSVRISHNGQIYTLRLTRNYKLILTK
jgi:hemin uptake protein HemP